MSFIVVIPARYASTRLPGKPLADIHGKPMIQHVYEQALKSGAEQVVIATDDSRVQEVAEQFGASVCMTSPDHNSGTERLAEVCQRMKFDPEQILVNVQGDEPLIPPRVIRQVADNLAQSGCQMATLSTAITDVDELFNPNAVKVVTAANGHALYFSRSPIPYDRDAFMDEQTRASYIPEQHQRHIGIYGYRAGFIQRYVDWDATKLERTESLEQLRVLWYGEAIHVAEALEVPPAGVDTPEDLELARKKLAGQA